MANATPALQAAATATADIPILGTSVTEYGVALGIENFDGLVGTNVSGTSDLAPLDQQAAMIKELFPDTKTVGLLFCSAEPNSVYQVTEVARYLQEMGIASQTFAFADANELPSVTQTACDNSDVIYIPTDNTAATYTENIANVVIPAGVPVICGEANVCKGCGVATLSIDYYDLGYATGLMAAKIIKGEADIATMPVKFAPQVTKMYNAANCETLNIQIPEGYAPVE
jgi:putative ABC transport system substrate-binding protein